MDVTDVRKFLGDLMLMRSYQREWFTRRDQRDLRNAKFYERRVDQFLELLQAQAGPGAAGSQLAMFVVPVDGTAPGLAPLYEKPEGEKAEKAEFATQKAQDDFDVLDIE